MLTHCPHCQIALPPLVDAYCPECRGDLSVQPRTITPELTLRPPRPRDLDLTNRDAAADAAAADTAARIFVLERRVAELERRLKQSALFSENFLSRAMTVLGHGIVAYLLLLVPLMVLAVCSGAYRGRF
jgi:hypothetical protein